MIIHVAVIQKIEQSAVVAVEVPDDFHSWDDDKVDAMLDDIQANVEFSSLSFEIDHEEIECEMTDLSSEASMDTPDMTVDVNGVVELAND